MSPSHIGRKRPRRVIKLFRRGEQHDCWKYSYPLRLIKRSRKLAPRHVSGTNGFLRVLRNRVGFAGRLLVPFYCDAIPNAGTLSRRLCLERNGDAVRSLFRDSSHFKRCWR
eukprot:150146-Rhodomonas_salina.1